MPPLDHDRCYAAASSRDARFDGQFIVAVRTTGIYCRPSCPAITPKSTNVEFHHTAAAAQQRGFRACKRCLPDATPGSPEWNVRQDLVGRAMRLIADGVVERDGVAGLAGRLGYSARHLTRLLTDEVGAGPLAIARSQRAHTARQLIETTPMSLTEIAFASGFGSVRQFNDTMRQVYASTPSDLRSRRRSPGGGAPTAAGTTATLRLATRTPFAPATIFAFLAARLIPGVESMDEGVYRRTLALPGGPGEVSVRQPEAAQGGGGPDHLIASLRLADWRDLTAAVQRTRRLFDLDADPRAIDTHLATDPALAPLVRATPGRRAPGSVDAFETLVRAIVGQQVSVAGARTVTAKLVDAVGPGTDHAESTRVFPSPAALADAPDDVFSMPTARRDTIRRAAAAVASGDIVLDVGADPAEVRSQLCALRGIGPWTADYVLMRGLGRPDVLLDTDLGVVHAWTALGGQRDDLRRHGDAWAPWRSYATHHLWGSLDKQHDEQKAG